MSPRAAIILRLEKRPAPRGTGLREAVAKGYSAAGSVANFRTRAVKYSLT